MRATQAKTTGGAPATGRVVAGIAVPAAVRLVGWVLALVALWVGALALAGDAAWAQDSMNGGSIDVESGVSDGQRILVLIVGLIVGVMCMVMLARKNMIGVFVTGIVGGFCLVFAADPTGTAGSVAQYGFDLFTGQGS